MYSTCLFCHDSLGRNDAIEHFPVGRRLAFDGAKGRLWVVCRKCERWNLTPLEERWEAIEECERAFRDTKLRVSTDHIGLARLKEGLELVRIGEAQRPEMAAWRYGDQFGRRTRRNVAYGVAGLAGLTALLWGGPAIGLFASGSGAVINLTLHAGFQWRHRRRPVARVTVPHEAGTTQRLSLALLHVGRTFLVALPDGGWALDMAYLSKDEQLMYTGDGLRHLTQSIRITGQDAQRAAAQILPHINTMVGRASTVQDAVRVLEDSGSADGTFARAARTPPQRNWTHNLGRGINGSLAYLPTPVRLALEMAAHEDSERRALEGELQLLEAAWKAAEEIAGIADNMFLPASVEEDLARLRTKRDETE